jgi:cytidylate kinase
MSDWPVIAIDGPSASGKGTVAERVAATLGFHYLDSGAIYRAAALCAERAGIGMDDPAAGVSAIAALGESMPLRFGGGRIWLGGDAGADAGTSGGEVDITTAIRSEQCGNLASRIAALPAVRAALLARQRAFLVSPGLVADGRDMASVVFPQATLKVFLTASAPERAFRRVAQLERLPLNDAKGLIENENNGRLRVLFDSVLADLQERDRRDAGRAAAPLKQDEGAKLLDTTQLSIEAAVARILGWYRQGS